MIKKLTSLGNSLGLIIERPILDLLDITKETPLEIKTDGEALIIRPLRHDHDGQVQEAAARMMQTHDAAFKKLAQ